ncbi:MAG: OmpH family outer membrane protein [Nitrospirae bacterium]|nr:OmpH family outer membrane protein [Nitrospirota bacterium]
MKQIFFMTFALLFAVVCSVQAAETKIGYVDLNKALNESEEGKKAVKVLEDFFKSKQAVLEDKRKEIASLDEEMAKQSSILNPDAVKSKKEERDRIARDFQRMVKDSEDELEKKRADFMERIIKDLNEVVKKIGEEEGYTVIFDRVQSGIMFIPGKLDLTDKLLKRFNEVSKSRPAQK